MQRFTRRTALLLPAVAAGQNRARLGEIRTISQEPDAYHGWPTVARRSNGDLVAVWSGGRESHVCPFGRVEIITSRDEGASWSFPRVLMDTGIDDRDAGIVETDQRSLLVTTFTSLAYESILAKSKELPPGWEAVQRRHSPEERRKMLGCWMLRSTDGGLTWSAPYRVPVNSPHGPVQVSGGRQLYAGKDLWSEGQRVGVCESPDDGVTWRWLAAIPPRAGDNARDYHELHLVETRPGHLIVHIRNHNAATRQETLQSESSDGGRSWTPPRAIGVWGLPSHLLRLRDGRLVMSYGYRRSPFGNQARISSDQGASWSEPITVSDDGVSGDLGYPSTVELANGSLLTIWYEKTNASRFAVLRQRIWTIR